MKALRSYQKFDSDGFFKDKKLEVSAIKEWQDYDSKKILGTKVDVIIIEDNTPYPTKNGELITNRYEKLTIKVAKPLTDIKARVAIGSIVTPVNAVCTVYGTYNNNLSVKSDDIKVIK